MATVSMPGHFQHVEMTNQIGLRVGERIFDRIANSRLRAQVHDPVDRAALDRSIQIMRISEIGLAKNKAAAEIGVQVRQTVKL